MNTIKQWWKRRIMIADNRRKAQEIDEQAIKDQCVANLQKYASEMQAELWSKKFTVLKGDYYPKTMDSVKFFALTPAGVLIRVIIGPKGGTSIGVVK